MRCASSYGTVRKGRPAHVKDRVGAIHLPAGMQHVQVTLTHWPALVQQCIPQGLCTHTSNTTLLHNCYACRTALHEPLLLRTHCITPT